MKVLVTGATGFLGQYIVEQLRARGDAVRALCRRPAPELEALGVEVVRGDATDRDSVVAACRGVDAVVHTAAVAGIWGPWERFYSTNVLGTRHVLDGCRAHGVGRLVYTSSPSVTFDGRPQRGVDESAPYPTKWLAFYPQTKAAAEQEVLAAHEPGRLHTCALRPHLIWGPRDRHLIPRLLDRARRGKLKRVGDGTNRVDVIYVENAAEAHLLALDRLADPGPAGGRAFFLSQGKPVVCWTWIDEILKLVDLPPVRRALPYGVAWSVGSILEGIWRMLGKVDEPLMTRFLAAQLAHDHYFDLTAARRDLGYEPRISTAEGMRRLGAWLRTESKPFPSNH
jgi:nucleoside-diphosphate-sugar epimerase